MLMMQDSQGGFDAAGEFSKAMVNAVPVVVPRCCTAVAVAQLLQVTENVELGQ